MSEPAGHETEATQTETEAGSGPVEGVEGSSVETPTTQTEAQKEQAGVQDTGPSDEAKEQAKADAEQRAEHPNQAVTREANPAVGGESFEYLGVVSG